MYSNSRNDVPRVAQRYGSIVAHTRRRASVLVVFVVFCTHMHSFAGLIRRKPPPTFSDTAITDRHSDTTIFQLRAHWVRISWSVGSEKSFGLNIFYYFNFTIIIQANTYSTRLGIGTEAKCLLSSSPWKNRLDMCPPVGVEPSTSCVQGEHPIHKTRLSA